MDERIIIEHTRRWIADMVIGLNLCPFAGRVFQEDRIRYVVTAAEKERDLLRDLAAEMKTLAASSIDLVETTLLICPGAPADFLDFNDMLDGAERTIVKAGLKGVLQIASFHPSYQFADTAADAVENYTNRSPYAMLHLLREQSITAVAGDSQEMLAIPARNIETLRNLGSAAVLAKLAAIAKGEEL